MHKSKEIIYCPCCSKKQDSHSGIGTEKAPKPDDISICFYCGTVCIFDKDLHLVKMPAEQLQELSKEDPLIYKMIIGTVAGIRMEIQKN